MCCWGVGVSVGVRYRKHRRWNGTVAMVVAGTTRHTRRHSAQKDKGRRHATGDEDDFATGPYILIKGSAEFP